MDRTLLGLVVAVNIFYAAVLVIAMGVIGFFNPSTAIETFVITGILLTFLAITWRFVGARSRNFGNQGRAFIFFVFEDTTWFTVSPAAAFYILVHFKAGFTVTGIIVLVFAFGCLFCWVDRLKRSKQILFGPPPAEPTAT